MCGGGGEEEGQVSVLDPGERRSAVDFCIVDRERGKHAGIQILWLILKSTQLAFSSQRQWLQAL